MKEHLLARYHKRKLIYLQIQNNWDNKIMSSKSHPQTFLNEVFTNSIIKVTVPEQLKQLGEITFDWEVKENENACELRKNINYYVKQSDDQYICTPLDYRKIITVKVLLTQNSGKFILEELHYGPVQLEEGLLSPASKKLTGKQSVKYVLNKSLEKEGTVQVLKSFSNPVKPVSKLLIKISEQTFTINIFKDTISPPKSNILKFYSDDPTSIGLSIYHQMTQFLQFIRHIKISIHSGYFLRIKFADRLGRDMFISEIMHEMGYKIEEMASLFAISGNVEKKIASGRLKISQVVGQISSNANQAGKSMIWGEEEKEIEEEEFKKDIIEDIYNILYTPLSSYHNEENFNNQSQFIKGSIIDLVHSLPGQSQIPNPEESDKIDSESAKTVKIQYQNLTFKKKEGLFLENLEQVEINNRSFEHEDHKERTATSSEKDDKNKRIEELLKINEELVEKNKKLEEENLRLRYENLKMNKNTASAPDISKMLQIKEMITEMATRLEVLEKEKRQKAKPFPSTKSGWYPHFLKKGDAVDKKKKYQNIPHQKSIIISDGNSRGSGPQNLQNLHKAKSQQVKEIRKNESLIDIKSYLGKIGRNESPKRAIGARQGQMKQNYGTIRSPQQFPSAYSPRKVSFLSPPQMHIPLIHSTNIHKNSAQQVVVSRNISQAHSVVHK